MFVLPSRGPDTHLGYQLKCVSGYCEVSLRNRDACVGSGGLSIHRRWESRVFYQDQLSLLGMGAESEEGSQQNICYRKGDQREW